MRQLIICADDFGMHAGVDNGIIFLAQQERISATSCLTQAPNFSYSAPALKDLNIDQGLHLNFTESFGKKGIYLPLTQLIISNYLRLLPKHKIRQQIQAQLDQFERHLQKVPDYIDGHQHIHQLPQIREQLIEEINNRYGKTKMGLRITSAFQSKGITRQYNFKAKLISVLGSQPTKQLAQSYNFIMNTRLLGVYDLSQETPYLELIKDWLDHSVNGDLLMCHPAQKSSANDGIGLRREEEFTALSSATFWEKIATQQIQICRYSDLS